LQIQTETILITPRYAQERATIIGSSTTFENRSIYLGPGGQDTDTRLQVPIVPAGRFSANASATIKITAALDGAMLGQQVDRDTRIGITDGRVMNKVSFIQGNFTYSVCWKYCIHMNDDELQLRSVVIVAP